MRAQRAPTERTARLWLWPLALAALYASRVQGETRIAVSIHWPKAARRWRLAAYRNPTRREDPDWRVTGARPASARRLCGVGNRARSSPISAHSVAATIGPVPGKVLMMAASDDIARSAV